MARLLSFLLVVLWLASDAAAQQPSADSTRDARVASQQVEFFGSSLTLGEIQREYARLRLLPVAQDSTTSDSPDGGIQRLEIDGLVVDETLTKLGRDFYDVFFRTWQAPQNAINFTVTVQEQPAPGNGTIVSVTVNDEIVFQSRLQPQLDQIELAAQRAAYFAYQHLERGREEIIY